jgi:cobalamin biosynthesis Mg chelatase CobN
MTMVDATTRQLRARRWARRIAPLALVVCAAGVTAASLGPVVGTAANVVEPATAGQDTVATGDSGTPDNTATADTADSADTTDAPDATSPTETVPASASTAATSGAVGDAADGSVGSLTWIAVVAAAVLLGIAMWWMGRRSDDGGPPSDDDWPRDTEVI